MSVQSNDSLERYIKLWETSKKLFTKELLEKEFSEKELSEFNFDDVRLNLVINPEINNLNVSQTDIPNDVELISSSAYFKKAVLGKTKLTEAEMKHDGWLLLDSKGYCAYADNVVYIGFPYKNSDIPLERAFIHELGHYIQQKKGYVIGCNPNENILLEYHNIMFHENIICTPAGDKSLYGPDGRRFTYNKIDHGIVTSQISQSGLSVSELITRLKGLVSTNQALVEEMENKEDINKVYNRLLLYNCYNELKAC